MANSMAFSVALVVICLAIVGILWLPDMFGND